MIVWVIAGLLAVATGLRIGWAMVNKQSVVSAAMMLALGSLAVAAALNWHPLRLFVDSGLRWPNVSVALTQVALIVCAAASCVMITTVASEKKPAVTRRLAWANYGAAGVIAAISLVVFFAAGRQPKMAPHDYVHRNLSSLPWLLPLLYVLFALTVVLWVGMRYSSPSRRGRALFVFTVGIGLIVLASGFFLLRAVVNTPFVGVGAAMTILACAMAVVAAGSLLPIVEDWLGARRELRTIGPLLEELGRRQPDVGIGVRPRGPLVYRVAERMSMISDALYLEALKASRRSEADEMTSDPPEDPVEQAQAIAQWIYDGVPGREETNDEPTPFPGLNWLRQPETHSDRQWILEIARGYHDMNDSGESEQDGTAQPSRSSADAG